MKSWLLGGVFAALLCVGVEGDARAADGPPQPVWYGTPGLVMDGAAVTTMTVGWIGMQNADVWLAGAGLHLVGAPIVHVMHGHPLRALASFGLRLGGATLGMLAGGFLGGALAVPNASCNGPNGCGFDGLNAIITGAVVGVDLSAIGVGILDAEWLAYDAQHTATSGSLVPYVGRSGPPAPPLAVSLGESAPGGFISPRMAWAVDSSQHRTPVFGVGGRF